MRGHIYLQETGTGWTRRALLAGTVAAAGVILSEQPPPARPSFRVTADAYGQFWIATKYEAETVRALFDSGAAFVHMPLWLSKKLGKRNLVFDQPRSTYFGTVFDARTQLSTLEAANIVVNDVAADVAGPKSGLQIPLLGMSWIKNFDVRIESGVLTLTPKQPRS